MDITADSNSGTMQGQLLQDLQHVIDNIDRIDKEIVAQYCPEQTQWNSSTPMETICLVLQNIIRDRVKRPLTHLLSRSRVEHSMPELQGSHHSSSTELFLARQELKIRDMGPNMTSTLAQHLAVEGKICFRISDMDIFNPSEVKKAVKGPAKDYAHTHVKYSVESGLLRLKPTEESLWKFPIVADAEKPRPDTIPGYLTDLAKSPPKQPCVYYSGEQPAFRRSDPDQLVFERFEQLLDPGEGLKRLPIIPGVNTVYWMFGDAQSGTAFHFEDAGLWSCNLVLSGYKLWILVRVSHNVAFENFVRKQSEEEAKNWECDQWVRHMNLMYTPEVLRAAGIEFDLVCAGPGDMVVTRPGQYHTVVNLTTCFAIAINFTLPDEPALRPTKACCVCGLYSLSNTAITKVAPQQDDIEEEARSTAATVGGLAPSTQSSSSSHLPAQPTRISLPVKPLRQATLRPKAPTQEIASTASANTSSKRKAKAVQSERVMKSQRLDHVSRRLDSETRASLTDLIRFIRSPAAIEQFCDLVKAKREPDPADTAFVQLSHGTLENAVYCLKMIIQGEQRYRTTKRLHQHTFAKQCAKVAVGRQRLDSTVKRKMLKEYRLSSKDFDRHRQEGNQWATFCGNFEGLLCFLPQNLSTSQMQKYLNDAELRYFHDRLAEEEDYITRICCAGKAFQESLGSDDISFVWESRNILIYDMTEAELLSNLQPVHSIPRNSYVESDFNGAPNPTLIPPNEEQCELCQNRTSERPCNCYRTGLPTSKLRIRRFQGKGLGIEAFGDQKGATVYKSGELLGFLTGKLVQKGTVSGDMAVDFVDCDIDCTDHGNCFRLMNHACEGHAMAKMNRMRVSGYYMLGVKAHCDIQHGTEITIWYGEGDGRPICYLFLGAPVIKMTISSYWGTFI
ncbi:histone-lysine N-methyltransferase activity/ cell cycle [Cryphonectria parasitica EP155]|uniref:Histone-lysine N-methyltransferase activity/ cell cycle n=1 Tax=Cryphonectria parasitica (strain ATCC 38755 / EP155) TaxID=660469 RepID=A0A9P4Y8K5_CRYP1|nr:histone-lysine N-methyltransferase activity/ cell cycle [Cryphonectria parasitica EP155]KAF3768342.1 histone-lysine N-methyltransferase activity/ cell cycle [Cryphonectria parasitica EP155]